VLGHRRSGSGPPLLIHGIGLDRHCWEPVRPLLEREREVVAVELPGFGTSPMPAEPPEIATFADAVEAFARELGLERPHVAGNSLGGSVALELGARGAARTVCALSPAGFALGRERAFERGCLRVTLALARRLAPHADRVMASAAARTLLISQMATRPWAIPAPAAAHMMRSTASAPGFEATIPAFDRWRPATPICPTTVAWAERDRLLLASRQAPRAARMLPAARHVILAGCGHVPMWDDPEQVAAVLLEASRDA
jgi:pimeloyl-ACP methyl ester carboxylesterase